MWLSECERNEPKVCEWNYVVKSTGGRNGAVRKEILGARDEVAKKICMEAHKQVNKWSIDVYIIGEKEINEQYGRKMNQDVSGNKLFLKKLSKIYGRNIDSQSRINDGNGSLALREDEMRRI